MDPQNTPQDSPSKTRRPFPMWKKGLLAVFTVVMATGGALWGYQQLSPKAEKPPLPASSPAVAPNQAANTRSRVPALGFGAAQPAPAATSPSVQAPRTTEQTSQDDQAISEDLPPALFSLGLSFIAAFCVAYALRAMFKLALVAIGLGVLAILALQHTGMISIDWGAVQGWYDHVGPWLSQQTAGLRQFVTGYLPSSASATAGLVAGFTRK